MSTFSKLSVSLPTDLVIKIDIERSKENLPRSAYIKRAVVEYLERKEEEDKKNLKGRK